MKKKLSLKNKRALTGLVFISPWLFGFLYFYLRGILQTIEFSLSDVSALETGGFTTNFIGLDNFRFAFFQDPEFNQIIVNTVVDILVDVPLIIFFSLFMAMLLNGKFRGRTVMRAIFFLPVIMNAGAINSALEFAQQNIVGGVSPVSSEVAAAATEGLNLNTIMMTFTDIGFPVAILEYITGAVSRIYLIVRSSGVQIVIFIAALQSIPHALYEVAEIEGATAYETFWKITFPMVSPLILTNIVYTIVDSFVQSEVVEKTQTVAFTNYNYGAGSAMSLVSTILVCIILGISGYIISKKTFYYN
ncbi:sugar ABC transporter permease [Alkalibacterium iburiense]|uniref:Sugar ABC transporter permease n=1 Tax=Alkalibacterium iburiense TaxID=290589 RepID=A0ABN0X342_9LACT